MTPAGEALTGDALAVVWHDIECGDYPTDLPLWRELAAAARGPVLDVGAGTGRVALDLAAQGARVTALDVDPALLDALGERARTRGLDVATVCADAAGFTIPDARFALCIVPMQSLQLLDGADARAGFFHSVREVLAAGGLLAVAIADALEGVDDEHTEPPLPDIREIDGVVYSSHPVAVRDLGDRLAIDRIREVVDVAGRRTATGNTVELHRVDAGTLAAEAAREGFAAEPSRIVPQTEVYVSSTVVMLRG